jgi:hypothetical protein
MKTIAQQFFGELEKENHILCDLYKKYQDALNNKECVAVKNDLVSEIEKQYEKMRYALILVEKNAKGVKKIMNAYIKVKDYYRLDTLQELNKTNSAIEVLQALEYKKEAPHARECECEDCTDYYNNLNRDR